MKIEKSLNVKLHTWNKATALGNLGDESESPWDTFLRSNNPGLTGVGEVLEIHLSPSLFDGLSLNREPAHHLPVEDKLSEDHIGVCISGIVNV